MRDTIQQKIEATKNAAVTTREPFHLEIATYSCGCRRLPHYVHIPRWAGDAVDGALEQCPEFRQRMEKARKEGGYRAFSRWKETHGNGDPVRVDRLEVLPPVTLDEIDALFNAA